MSKAIRATGTENHEPVMPKLSAAPQFALVEWEELAIMRKTYPNIGVNDQSSWLALDSHVREHTEYSQGYFTVRLTTADKKRHPSFHDYLAAGKTHVLMRVCGCAVPHTGKDKGPLIYLFLVDIRKALMNLHLAVDEGLNDGGKTRYVYFDPMDKRTEVFCERLRV